MAERALSAEEVVRTALALLDEVGLRAFTMRALAARLGTYPATIYWHVGNRTEVLSAINGSVLDDMAREVPDRVSTSWDEWLIQTARIAGRCTRILHSRCGPSRISKRVCLLLISWSKSWVCFLGRAFVELSSPPRDGQDGSSPWPSC